MSNVWSEFNDSIDNDQIQKDIDAASKNQFKEVPAGTYRVSVDKMEPKVAKSGNPMCSIQFKILRGEFKNSRIFYNQVVHNGIGIHNNNEFLKSLDVDCVNDMGDHLYKNMEQYAQLIMDAAEEIDEFGLTYDLYYPGKDSWASDYEIKDVYEK